MGREWWFGAILMLFTMAGCADLSGWRAENRPPQELRIRNSPRAIQLNDKGLEACKAQDWEAAVRHFEAAIDADAFYGPAQNNLGVAYLHQKKYYQAAWAFRHASKLMPQVSGPHNNLGLVYEAVGRVDEAIQSYEQALELDANDVVTIGHLARGYVKAKRDPPKLHQLLADLALRADSPDWSTWAQEQLVRLYGE